MKVLEGKLVATKGKFAIVGARFNEFIVSKLISGAEDTLVRHGVDTDDITLVWVPGAFEIPLAAQKLAQSGKYDAVICLGAVIRGSTSHYDLVCNEAAKGIAQVNLQTGVPVTFGVITTENIEQAIERAGTRGQTTRAQMQRLRLSSWQTCCRRSKIVQKKCSLRYQRAFLRQNAGQLVKQLFGVLYFVDSVVQQKLSVFCDLDRMQQ